MCFAVQVGDSRGCVQSERQAKTTRPREPFTTMRVFAVAVSLHTFRRLAYFLLGI